MADMESRSRRPSFVETLREGWKPPQRRSKMADPSARTEASTATESAEATKEAAATKTPNGASTKPAATRTGAGASPPEPNLMERLEGVQGWMAELERKQGWMTYFGAAATALAVLAAAAALYLAITTPNSASKDDFDDLEAQVQTLQEQINQATADQARLKALNSSIQSLDSRVAASEQKANQQASEIAAVKAQAQAAQQAAATATPAPAPTTPTTPGATKQP
jgi:hypothetical protein